MTHHDYNNAPYWGIPTTNEEREIVKVVIDMSNPIRILGELINDCVTEGEYCEELKKHVLNYTCRSLLSYVKQDFSPLGSSDENSYNAIQCLMDYQLSPIKASEIFHQVENSVIKALLNIIPEIDDERKYVVMDHKLISGSGLYLTLGVKND